MMTVTINGKPVTVEPGTTVADLVARYSPRPGGRGAAVAVNGEVVPRGRWDNEQLGDDDKVEVLGAVGGG